MRALPRILSWLLLLGGALAWLIGPAPARPQGLEAAAGGPTAEDPPPVEIWLDDSDAVAAAPGPAPATEWSESDPGDARAAAPAPAAPPDVDAALDLVRRMLALHARMAEE